MEAIKKENPTVIVRKLIKAPKEKVFEALTDVSKMQQWMIGKEGSAKIQADIKVGGKYSNEMFFKDEQTQEIVGFKHNGEYLEISAPNRIVFTWNSPSVSNTIVTFELTEKGLDTEVTITHELGSGKSEDSDGKCSSHEQGWTYALSQLASLCAS